MKAKRKYLALALVLVMVLNVLVYHGVVYKAQAANPLNFKTTMSSTDLKKGDIVDVSVVLENYAESTDNINVCKVQVPINTDYFEMVKQEGDTSANYSKSITLGFSKTSDSSIGRTALVLYSASKKCVELSFADAEVPLEKNTTTLITFQLKVKTDLTADVAATLTNETSVSLNGESQTAAASTGVDYTIAVTDPKVSLNGAANTGAPYTDSVVVSVDKGTAVVSDGKNTVNVTKDTPYTAKKNGTYTVTTTKLDGTTATETFTINLAVSSISVSTQPSTLTYIERKDTKIDVTGGKVTVTYVNGETDVVDLTDAMCTGYDLSTPGTSTVTVTYVGKTTSFDVTVKEKSVASIAIKTAPTKTVYTEGTTIDVTGGKITVTYDNNETADVDMTASMLSTVDMTKTGTKDVTVTYQGKTTTFAISVVEKQAASFTLSGTEGLTVTEGLELPLTGVKAHVTYDNGTTADVDVTQGMISYTDAPGTQTVTVKIDNVTETFTIEVKAKVATSIAIETSPKTSYKIGDAFSLENGTIVVSYNNNTKSDPIAITKDMITPAEPDMTVGNDRTITVTYNGLTTSYKYSVADRILTGITVKAPTKTTYIEKNTFSVEGGEVTEQYDNNTTEKVTLTASMCSGYDMNKVGTQTVTVTHAGKTTTFTITVNAKSVSSIEVAKQPTSTTVIEGLDFSVAGGQLKVTYDNGETETIDMAKATVSGFDNTKVGSQTVTLTYEKKTATITVTVKAKTLTGISITTAPEKKVFLQGTALDTTGMVITAAYDNNTTETVEGVVSGYDSEKAGKQTITVTYQNKTVTYEVEVVSRADVDDLLAQIKKLQAADLTVDDQKAVEAVRTAYDKMTEVEKAAIDEAAIKTLEDEMFALLYPVADMEDKETGVTVTAPVGIIEYDAFLQVTDVTSKVTDKLKDVVLKSFGNQSEMLQVFDITLMTPADKKVQPLGQTTVKIVLTDAIKEMAKQLAANEKLLVIYIDDDGNMTDMNATFTDEDVTFTTTHFSQYAIVKAASKTEETENKDTTNSETENKESASTSTSTDSTTSTSSGTTTGTTVVKQTGDTAPSKILVIVAICAVVVIGATAAVTVISKKKRVR